MLKMTVALAVALYAGFVIWGTPSETLTAERAGSAAPVRTAAAMDYDRPVILSQTATGAAVARDAVTELVVPDAATIAASAPDPEAVEPASRTIGEPIVISLVENAEEPEAPSAATDAATAAPEATAGRYRVSGTRVNMRSGPSTADAVVDSLPGGTLAEVIGEETDGWVQIRDVNSGLTGYMAARFLEPA